MRQLDGNTGEHNRKTEVGVVQRVDLHQIEPVVRRQHATQAVTQLACLFTLVVLVKGGVKERDPPH